MRQESCKLSGGECIREKCNDFKKYNKDEWCQHGCGIHDPENRRSGEERREQLRREYDRILILRKGDRRRDEA